MASRYSAQTASTTNEATRQMASLKQFTLNDLEVVKPVDEFGDSTMVNLSVLPGVFFQQHGNSLALRHIIPKSVDETELSWTFFGFADDDEAMRRRRRKQSNLVGPAGYVAADDSEVLASVQAGVGSAPEAVQVIEMGGRDTEPKETMVSETLLRAFYDFYRPAMGL
jgi:anthranilate 1,2-dioxygenase large subunit